MRNINKIIIHCSATPEGRDVSIETIKGWHLDKGWNDIGYHYVIHLDGSIHKGRPDNIIGAHTQGHNSNSIGICYVGGCDIVMRPKDTRTPEQKESLINLINELKKTYKTAVVHGHRDFSNKACPSFDATNEYE